MQDPKLVAPINIAQTSTFFSNPTFQNNVVDNEFTSPLAKWLDRKCSLPDRLMEKEKNIDFNQAFVGIDFVYPLHLAPSISEIGRGLKKTWEETNLYIERSKKVANIDYRTSLDRWESSTILEEVGKPPKPCYSLYFISVGSCENERLVYIGMTGKDTHRFKSSYHKAAWALHRPEYLNLEKKIYLGTIFLLDNKLNYLPVEWVQELEYGYTLLDSIESQLIHYFQPELNDKKTVSYCANYPFNCILLQNFTSSILARKFLDNLYVCWAPQPNSRTPHLYAAP